MFNKIKYVIANCHFCGEKGNCLGAVVETEEIAVCEPCANKLIAGISTAIAELKKRSDEKDQAAEKSNEPNKS